MARATHTLSPPDKKSSLHLLNVQVTDVSIKIVSSKWVDYESIQTGTNAIEFVIKPLADYIEINKTELRLVLKITKEDGSPSGDGKSTLWSAMTFPLSSNSLPFRSTKRCIGDGTTWYVSFQFLHKDVAKVHRSGQGILSDQSYVLQSAEQDIWMMWIM